MAHLAVAAMGGGAVAHRGFTSFRLPMNKGGAFQEAAASDRYIETDVRATRDGAA